MANAGRKKQPQLSRAQLLAATAEEAVEKGLAAVTLEAVARRAGLSKGGLLHHYPNRQALIEAMYQAVLDRFGSQIQAHVAADPHPAGKFSRAYLLATVSPASGEGLDNRIMAVAALAMSTDRRLARIWQSWLAQRIRDHGEKETSVTGRLVRLATDGLWLEECQSGPRPETEDRRALIRRLTEMSHAIEGDEK